MSYLRDLLAHSGFQHIVCCVFLHLVYPVLPVSLDYSFLIALSVLSNVYLHWKHSLFLLLMYIFSYP